MKKSTLCFVLLALFVVPIFMIAITPAFAQEKYIPAAGPAYSTPEQKVAMTVISYPWYVLRHTLFGGAAADALARAKNENNAVKGYTIIKAYTLSGTSGTVIQAGYAGANIDTAFTGNTKNYIPNTVPADTMYLIESDWAFPLLAAGFFPPFFVISPFAGALGAASATGASVIIGQVAQ